MIDDMIVEAEDLDEAIQLAEELPLPKGEYCDSSFEVNTELIYSNPGIYGEQKTTKRKE